MANTACGAPKPLMDPATALFVYTTLPWIDPFGNLYGLAIEMPDRMKMLGPEEAYAPVSASISACKAVKRPSEVTPVRQRITKACRLVVAAKDSARL